MTISKSDKALALANIAARPGITKSEFVCEWWIGNSDYATRHALAGLIKSGDLVEYGHPSKRSAMIFVSTEARDDFLSQEDAA